MENIENMENVAEISLDEMEQVSGGRNEGGYERKPKEKKNCFIYRIQRGDKLGVIARNNHTTVDAIMRVNPELKNSNFIVAGCYIYIPA